LIDFAVNFLLSVPVQVIAWMTVSKMTCNVSSGTLNLTYSLTFCSTLLRPTFIKRNQFLPSCIVLVIFLSFSISYQSLVST